MKQLLIKSQIHNLTFEEVLTKFHPLCVKFTQRTFVDSYETEDKMQVCRLALFRAYKNYDVQKGIDFCTLAYGYVKNDMTRLIRDSKNGKRDTSDITFVDIYGTLGGSSEAQTYLESIPDKVNIETDVINTYLTDSLLSGITEQEKLLIPVLLGNKTQLQYSKEVGISNEGARKRVNAFAARLRKKLDKMG